jgi:hypothetical protein
MFTRAFHSSPTAREAPVAERYVGIDLHRRRSVIYAMDAEGNKLSCVRIDNSPVALADAVAQAVDAHDAEVVVEACFGVVLGRRPVVGRGLPHPPVPPRRQRLGQAAGQERRA